MKKFYRVNGIAFNNNILAWKYVDTYLMGDEARYVPIEEEGEEEKIYSTLESYERDNPEACIQRLRTERFFFKKEEDRLVDLPIVVGYSIETDFQNHFTNQMAMTDLYRLVRCGELTIKDKKMDKENKNLELVVPVPSKDGRRNYKITEEKLDRLSALAYEYLSKLSDINEKIEKAIEEFGIKDENLKKENAQYRKFQKQYVAKIKASFDEKQFVREDERDSLINELAGEL